MIPEENKDWLAWAKPVNDVISVPDKFDKLVNQLAFQFRLHTISERFGEAEMLCRMVRCAEIHFEERIKELEEGINIAQADLRSCYKRLGFNGGNVIDKLDQLLNP